MCRRFDELASEHPDGDDAPEAVRAELDVLEAELDALDARERAFRPEDVARAGATIVLTGAGTLRIERGYIRPEDEPQPDPQDGTEGVAADFPDAGDAGDEEADERPAGAGKPAAPEAKPPALPADLDAELSLHRTLALRAEVIRQPDLALRVLAHSLATAAFYGPYNPTLARLAPSYGAPCAGGSAVPDSPARQAIRDAEDRQRAALPPDHAGLWAWLDAQDVPTLHALLALCVGRVAEAGGGDWTGDAPPVAALVARRAGLDMRRWWSTTRAAYLGRVTKAGILAAVREGAGEDAARRIDGMKKDAMAETAEALLIGKGWLPARLRVPGAEHPADDGAVAGHAVAEEACEAVAAE